MNPALSPTSPTFAGVAAGHARAAAQGWLAALLGRFAARAGMAHTRAVVSGLDATLRADIGADAWTEATARQVTEVDGALMRRLMSMC